MVLYNPNKDIEINQKAMLEIERIRKSKLEKEAQVLSLYYNRNTFWKQKKMIG